MTTIKKGYIAVEGNIGAGKTSLAKQLAAALQAGLVLEEFAENTFLPQFYTDPSKYAFPLELSFLAARYKQHMEFIDNQHIKKIEIKLVKKEDKLILRITDDGDGFETATVAHGNGLNNMEQRAKVMGGKLSIDSVAGKGTTVSLITKA